MFITTVHSDKLFIHFDSIINKAIIEIINEKGIKRNKDLNNTEFGFINIPKNSTRIDIKITINNKAIIKTISIKH